jgi:hypothetical protein
MSQDGDTSACVLVTIDQTLITVRGNKCGRNMKRTTHLYEILEHVNFSFFGGLNRPTDDIQKKFRSRSQIHFL